MQQMTFPISRKGDGLRRALFLCEDNHLESRFCEELFNSLVRDEGLNWQAVSRALSPVAARRHREPMARDAIACLRQLGAAPMNHGRLPLGATEFDFETSFVAIAIAPAGKDPGLRDHWPKYASQVEIWPVNAALPVAGRLRELQLAVGEMLDRMLGRRAAEAAAATPLPVAGGSSARLGSRGYQSRQAVTLFGGEAPHAG